VQRQLAELGLHYHSYAPIHWIIVVFTSAKPGQHLTQLLRIGKLHFLEGSQMEQCVYLSLLLQ